MTSNDSIEYDGLHHLAVDRGVECIDVELPVNAQGIKANGQPITGAA